MEKDYIIVSVESRKGGVGKTTAALNMANKLKDKGYIILLLDADITGTDSSEIQNNTFWSNSVTAIKQDGKPINLLEEFEKKFLTGDFIRSFTTDNNDTYNLFIDVDKINILGSQIYNLNGGRNKYTCNPSIIFDELHAFWFVEYISLICKQFFNLAIKNNKQEKTTKNPEKVNHTINRKYAIIIDNSPGYIGIAPMLQEILTDIGPVKGKFLFVTSLDKQDLISCKHSLNKLYDIYKNKNSVATLYNGEKDFAWKDEYKDFFNKMVENISPDLNDGLKYYFKDEAFRNKFIDHPEKYLAVLINKVPDLIKRGYLEYDYEGALDAKDNTTTFESIISLNNNRVPEQYLISYNDIIEYQFYHNSLLDSKMKRLNKTDTNKNLDKIFKDLKDAIPQIPSPSKSDEKDIIFYITYFNLLKRILHKFKAFLYNNQLHPFLPLLEDFKDYNDLTINFEQIFKEILGILKLSTSLGYRTGNYSKIIDFYVDIYSKVIAIVKNYNLPLDKDSQHDLATITISISITVFPYIYKRKNPKEEKVILDLFSFVALYFYLSFRNAQAEEKTSFFAFIERENSSQELRREIHYPVIQSLLEKYHINLRIFQALCNSLVLPMVYIDRMQDDIILLKNVIGTIINEGNYNLSFISMVRDLFKKAVLKRSISLEKALSEFASLKKEAYKMAEFEHPINEILEKWGIA